MPRVMILNGSAKGGPIQFWELFTMILCTLKEFRRYHDRNMGTPVSQIKYEGSSNVEELTYDLWFYDLQEIAAKDHGKKFRSKLAASFCEIVHWVFQSKLAASVRRIVQWTITQDGGQRRSDLYVVSTMIL